MEDQSEIQEVTQEDVENLVQAEDANLEQEVKSLGSPLQAIKKAVKDGVITPQQARNFRRDMGIGQGFFTDKQINPSKRKAKNKAAKKARKVNRKKK